VYDERVIDGPQTRGARAMLGWSQRHLSEKAQVPLSAVKALEAGGDVRVSVATAVERAFLEAGLIFLEPGDLRDGGRGLRFRQ
jgi:ribosome-binding protein aMBF1 (putative translation factor)